MSQNSSQLKSTQAKLDLSKKIWLEWLKLTALVSISSLPSLFREIGKKCLALLRRRRRRQRRTTSGREERGDVASSHHVSRESWKMRGCIGWASLRGYVALLPWQCTLRLLGWEDGTYIWSDSHPMQPFSLQACSWVSWELIIAWGVFSLPSIAGPTDCCWTLNRKWYSHNPHHDL